MNSMVDHMSVDIGGYYYSYNYDAVDNQPTKEQLIQDGDQKSNALQRVAYRKTSEGL